MSVFAVNELRAPHHSTSGSANRHAGEDKRKEVAVGGFAVSVVHDIRNPLAAIHLGAEILSGSQLPEQQVRQLARNMYHASVRIQKLLQDYLDLCRTRERQMRPHNLRNLVAQAVGGVAATAAAQSVAVACDIPADLVVALDSRQIEPVITNLLINALESMPGGGSIHISAIAAERSVVIRVLDSGPGVAPEIRERLFQPFVTAGKPNGWGLGLAQARQAVISHGGEMWLESSPGTGACFAFSLPAS